MFVRDCKLSGLKAKNHRIPCGCADPFTRFLEGLDEFHVAVLSVC